MDKFIEQDAEIKQLRSTVAQQERKLSEFSHYMLTVVPLLIETPRSLMSGSSSQQQQQPQPPDSLLPGAGSSLRSGPSALEVLTKPGSEI